MASAPRRTAFRLHGTHACAFILLSASTLLLSACGNFFSCEGKESCPCATGVTATATNPCGGSTGTTGTTGTGSSTLDYAYVTNSATSANDVNGYNLGSGTLTAATSAPFSFGFSPSALVVTPADTFLYAATDSYLTTGLLYGYSIESGGALNVLSSGQPLTPGESVSALAVSPNGDWLFCLDTEGLTLEEYSIDTSTGAITYANTYGITGATGATITPSSVTVAPSGDFLVVTLGTAGAQTFSFNETTGVATAVQPLTPSNAATGIFAAAIDTNNYLYLAGTDGVSVYSTTTGGIPTLLNTYATGIGTAHSVVVNNASTYVYVGNESTGTIYGFSIGTNAALTAVTGSPYTAPTSVAALAFDSTNAYLLASGYNATTGIQLFSIGTTGALSSLATAGTGTSTLIPGAIAATR